MAEPFTIYKLTILSMLDHASFPLTNTQITNFFLEQEYTDYFRVQEVIRDLSEAGFVSVENNRSATQYSLTPSGKEVLEFLHSKVSAGIESDIKAYFDQNSWNFRQENAIVSDYRRNAEGKYLVSCQYRSGSTPVIDLTLAVNDREQAEAICKNWKKSYMDVYTDIVDQLIQ